MAALPFARGRHVVLYDAEDRPASGQLREAAETFAAAPARLGCLQAPLRIDLPGQGDRLNWLKSLYAADYDALFGIILPAMAHLNMPLPLGGTSNHFRIEALTESGGWDPFNVTEDADLGFRLARRGWSVGTIGAPTFEEAPATLPCWVKQRTRWFKGWLQTLAVVARNAPRLPSELGFKGLAALAVTVLGSTATAILHLVCMFALAVSLARSNFGLEVLATLAVAFIGYGATAMLLAKGAQKAGRRIGYGTLLALPLFWLLMGLAAFAAIAALARRPYHWAKTEHGLQNSDIPAGVAFIPVSGANQDMAGPKVQTRDVSSSDVSEMLAHRFVETAEKALVGPHHDRATATAAAERFRQKLAVDGAGSVALAIIDAHIEKLSGS
jgi:cellulose synthase/poly-beta-1,6-N-acetylglucosamine synthase-like glycosyltransferase